MHMPALADLRFCRCSVLHLLRIVLASFFVVWASVGDRVEAALTWDSTNRAFSAVRGQTNAAFTFSFANTSTNPIAVRDVRASCHCTTPQMPFALPGIVSPESSGHLVVNVDLRDRNQPFKQTITVETSSGTDQLFLDIKTPELTVREKNRLAAFADRQAVFKGECAKCHLQPAQGKPLAEQVKVLCGTCHDSPDRAEMVPDLAAASTPRDRAYWDQWVRRGKPGTFMPAFGKRWGGPLGDDDLAAVIDYLSVQRKQ